MKAESEAWVRASKNKRGTTPRGVQRRGALIDATLRIVLRDGPGAVTVRSVTNEAGASHGSVTYYFGGAENLIREALVQVAVHNIAALADAWSDLDRFAGDPAQLAARIARHSVRQMIEDRRMGITIVELHLAVARNPELAPALREWGRAFGRITHHSFVRLGSMDPEADSAVITNLITGMMIRQLALPRPDFESTILTPSIERLLTAIGAGKA